MSWVEEQSWYGLEDTLDFDNYYDELTGEILWETKTFELIPVSQMTTSHIQNALRMCIKNNWRTEYIQIFQEELEKRNFKE